MKIGIVGNGFVGKATRQLENSKTELLVYDVRPELCSPAGLTLADMASCEVIFICVPTPMEASGACHLGMVESVVQGLRPYIDESKTFMVLRSTVPPGTCKKLGCYFMPEFLTEKRYLADFTECRHWVFGVLDAPSDDAFRKTIRTLFQYAWEDHKILHTNLEFMLHSEAEMVKYVRNTYLASKVSFFNEMEEFCRLKGIHYERVREISVLDERIGGSHTMVPGHDGKRGFGGTCFPKDTNSLLYQMKEAGMKSYVLQGVIHRNSEVDRSEADRETDKGRAVV